MTECFETITQLQMGLYTVRVWSSVEGFVFGNSDLKDELQLVAAKDPRQIFLEVKKKPNVSACEIKSTSGQGMVWYREWP